MKKYRYETHLHTAPISKCARVGVKEVLEFYKSEDYAGVLVLYAKAIELQLKSVVSVDDLRIKDTPTLSTLFDKYVKTYPWYDAKYVDFAKRHLIPYRNKGAHSEKISRETMSAIRRYLYDGGFLNSFNR